MSGCKDTGLQTLSGDTQVVLQDCYYEVVIEDFVANVKAKLSYKNEGDDEQAVCFNFPRKLNETAYTIHKCKAMLGIEIVESVTMKENEVQKAMKGRADLDKNVVSDEYTYSCVLGVLGSHTVAEVVVEFTFELSMVDHGSLFFMIPVIRTNGEDVRVHSQLNFFTPYEATDLDGCPLNKVPMAGKMGHYSWTDDSRQSDTGLEFTIHLNMQLVQKNGLSIFVEDGEDYEDGLGGKIAMVSTWLSPADFPASPLGEFIFIVDRSGSMGGSEIKHAGETLLLFLKSLPVGCYFNIVSFGSSYKALFAKSQLYGPDTLAKATQLQRSLTANMGGTSFCGPLRFALDPIAIPGHPRYVFILTDGGAHDKPQALDLVKRNAHKARVCAFGIGSGVDEDLVKEISRLGGGVHEFVEAIDRQMETKVMGSLQRAMDACLTNVSLDWTLPEGMTVETLTDVPHQIRPGRHWVVFVEIKGDPPAKKGKKKSVIPQVALTYTKDGRAQSAMLPLDVQSGTGSLRMNHPLHRQLAVYRLNKLIADEASNDTILKHCQESGIHHHELPLVAKNAATGTLTGVVRSSADSATTPAASAAVAATPPPPMFGIAAAAAPAPRPWPAAGAGIRRGRRVLRSSIDKIPKTAFRRLAQRGGVARCSGLVYEEMKGQLTRFLETIIRDCCTYVEHSKRKMVTQRDVDSALRNNGVKLYGIEDPALHLHEVETKRPRRATYRYSSLFRTTPIGNPTATASIGSVLGVSPVVRGASKRGGRLRKSSSGRSSLRKSTSNASSGHGASLMRKSISNASAASTGKRTPVLTKKSTLILSDEDGTVNSLSKKTSVAASQKSTASRSSSVRGGATKRKQSSAASETLAKQAKVVTGHGKTGKGTPGRVAKGKQPMVKSKTRSQRKAGVAAGAKDFVSMVNLISLQNYDGTWDMNRALADIIGSDTVALSAASSIKNLKAWATALALAYLEVHFKQAKMEWEMIAQKSLHYLKTNDLSGHSTDTLVAEAEKYV